MKVNDLTWAGTKAELFLFVPADNSGKTELIFESAKMIADSYLERDFESIPNPVKLGVFSFVREALKREDTEGLTSAKTKDLAESYAKAFAMDSAYLAAKFLWKPYKNDILL